MITEVLLFRCEVSMQVLDKGYCEIINSWGTDETIIEAARMSTNKGFLGWDNDVKLLRYLYEHKHLTPFEMCGATFEVKAPIMVFREWHRHRTQSYNEMSGRYTILPDEYYVPSLERAMASKQDTKNKQGSYAGFSEDEATSLQRKIRIAQEESRRVYDELIETGVSKEIARLVLPVSQFSRMRASANLRNWMQFLSLRLPSNAQWEIRQYAKVIQFLLEQVFPRTMGLFNENPL